MDKPIFLPAELYEQLLTFIASDAQACAALGINAISPARHDVIVGLGGHLDFWSEEHQGAIQSS